MNTGGSRLESSLLSDQCFMVARPQQNNNASASTNPLSSPTTPLTYDTPSPHIYPFVTVLAHPQTINPTLTHSLLLKVSMITYGDVVSL